MAADKPATTPAGGKDRKLIEAEAPSAEERLDAATRALQELRKASDDLMTKITDAKRCNDIPLDSALGSPDWERSAADGHLDLPDKDDD